LGGGDRIESYVEKSGEGLTAPRSMIMMKAAAMEMVAPDNVASVRSLCTYNGKSVRWGLMMNEPSIGRVGRSFLFSNLPQAKL